MKDYADGPVSNERRSKTDCFCCIIFILFFIAMLIIAIYSWSNRNFSTLDNGYDPDGKGCGIDYPEYPYIYFASPHPDSLWVTVCVKQCPKQGDSNLNCKPNSRVGCEPINSAQNEKAVQIYDSFALGPVCMPSSHKIQDEISGALASSSIGGKISQITKSWQIILLSLPIVIVLSLLFMILMRLLSQIFVYLLFVASVVAFIGMGVYLLLPQNQGSIGGLTLDKTFLIVIGIISIILGVAILFIFICYRKRVALAATMTKVAARFVQENCLISLMPFALFGLMALFAVLCIFEGLGYYSMGIPLERQQKQLPFQHFQLTTFVEILLLVHFFQFLWGMFFLVETDDFIVAGTATSWYYQRQNPFCQSIHRFIKFHNGSVAMGSFFMALLGFIKFLYELFHTQEEEQQEGFMSYCRKCCNCCCYLCVTYMFNWFNNGAYTYIHLAGDSYCTSAWEVLSLRIQQPLATGIVTFLEALFSILVRLGITGMGVGVCSIIMKNVEPFKDTITDSTAALIVIGMIAFAVSSFFVSLYSEAIEAVYVCFLADSNAGGWDDKAPKQLLGLLEEVKKENHFIQ